MNFLRYFILMLAIIMSGNMFAQKSQQELAEISKNHGEYYFSLPVQQPADIQSINQLCSVDDFDGQNVVCYANHKQYENLIKYGYKPVLMMPPSLQVKVKMWDGTDRANYDWDAYPTYEAYEAMMYQFGTDHPDRCEIINLGTLPSGHKILIAHLNNGSGDGKPKFLYTSTIHGDETTGWIIMLRLIDYLLENPDEPEVQNVMDNLDLFIGPLTNPDGTYHGGNNTVYGAIRENANLVDMNRNYPDPNSGPHPDGEEYQLETQWFMQFAQDIPFTMGANYHGGAEVVNYPWDNTYTLHPDDAWFQLTGHEYANLTHQEDPNYMTGFDDGITNGAAWYMIGGGRQDYMNGYAQCREVTIECSNTKLVPENQLPTFWDYNKNAMFALMNQCRYGIHGTVTDKATGAPLNATITIEGHDNEFSTVSSHLPAGDYHRPIKGGTYTLNFTSSGYYPQSFTVTVADGETVVLDVELEAGEGLIPDFSASNTQVALGNSINFTDETWGAHLTSWEWQFEAPPPATSTEQNPTGITYNEAGTFDVTLTVTNQEGQTETITKSNYITAAEAYNMQDATIVTCNAFFYDNGGPDGNYSNREDYTLTFLPTGDGRKISVNFTEFDIESYYDYLYVYDGSSTSATQIGEFTGSNNPGELKATNSEGALTFRFTSDNGVTALGWAAEVHCIYDDPLSINVSADPEVINAGETSQLKVEVTGGAGGYSYLWEPAETLDNPTSDTPVATPIEAETTYTVTVTDADGNTATGDVTVTIRDWSLPEDHCAPTIYPNPNKGSFTINVKGTFSYRLFNSIGQEVMSGEGEGITIIDVSSLNQGVYFLQLTAEGTQVEKVVIEK